MRNAEFDPASAFQQRPAWTATEEAREMKLARCEECGVETLCLVITYVSEFDDGTCCDEAACCLNCWQPQSERIA